MSAQAAAAEIERLRVNLLRQLKAADPMSLSIDRLRIGAMMEGFVVTDREVAIECEHLSDPDVGFIRLSEQPFSMAVKRFKLAAKGREWVEQQGF